MANKSALLFFSIALLTITKDGECVKILGVFPTPSISHQAVFQTIIRELALRGHELTILTPNPINDPSLKNLTEIDLSEVSYEIWSRYSIATLGTKERVESTDISSFVAVFDTLIDAQMQHPEVLALINDKSLKFDLLLVEFLWPSSYGFKDRFKCPMIGIASMPLLISGADAIGNPTHPALYPDYNLPFSNTLSFFEKLHSFIFQISYRLYGYSLVPKINAVVRKYLGEQTRCVKELAREVSLVLSNVNPVLSPARPNVPALIEITGIHIKKPQDLPADLKKFMDSSKHGVVYLSFGSNVKSSLLPKEKLDTLLDVIRELPYDVIWKFEADDLPNKPKNLRIMKWTPQQDLLRHPNMKVFVFQGGLQSLEEAIFSDVPVVAVPFFGDQHGNARKIKESGVGLSIDFLDITKDKLKDRILEVAQFDKYRNRIKELHAIAIDQPMTGLEKSMWWIEYVLRHNGAPHLKNAGVEMPLYQYFLVDVLGFLLLFFAIVGYILIKLSKLLLKTRYLL